MIINKFELSGKPIPEVTGADVKTVTTKTVNFRKHYSHCLLLKIILTIFVSQTNNYYLIGGATLNDIIVYELLALDRNS